MRHRTPAARALVMHWTVHIAAPNVHSMVQNARPSSGRPGRPPAFDSADVISAAIDAFMSKGFEATTLNDLEAATGVDRSTLYNSFGGKSGLYHQATGAYLARAQNGLFWPLHEGSADGIADVVEFLRRLGDGLTASNAPPGCLIVNDMAAGADPPAARRYLQLLNDGLRAALARAAASGDGDVTEIPERARLISAAVIGINLISRHSTDGREVAQLVDAAIAQVRSWRETPLPVHSHP